MLPSGKAGLPFSEQLHGVSKTAEDEFHLQMSSSLRCDRPFNKSGFRSTSDPASYPALINSSARPFIPTYVPDMRRDNKIGRGSLML
jgi:hypothetical protein